ITATARTLQSPTESRTLTQLRADIAAKLLLSAGFTTTNPHTAAGSTGNSTGNTANSTDGVAGSTSADGAAGRPPATDGVDDVVAGRPPATDWGDAGGVPSPAAQVLVTVPVFALMGLTDEPADLDGYGPIPASMARSLVADGASSFRRVLTDPRDGEPLAIGRASYRIPAAMRQWLRMRDGRCSFPGCSNQSLDNEADHILAWADGGTTGIANLSQVCRKHHRLKHTTGWTPTDATKDEPPGWTSPTGRHYQSEHHDREAPHWPRQILDLLSNQGLRPAEADGSPPDRPLPTDSPPKCPMPEEFFADETTPEAAMAGWGLAVMSAGRTESGSG
ncbi:MAG TPA: HNH endonuclease, partial [Arthrobacter sp.]|nr:HNH endonuclease [Arthrobacter sp.]